MGVPDVSSVRVAGVGLHPFGRFDGRTGTAMGVVAVRAALAEADIGVRDVQAAFCGTAYGGVAAGHRLLGALPGTGPPLYHVGGGGPAGGGPPPLRAPADAAWQHDPGGGLGGDKMAQSDTT